jgi:hypothetical protein
MSIFRVETVSCPACSQPVEFNLVYSVNAGRRPDLRQAILDGSFQRETCPKCKALFRVEPEMTYFDVGRKQWILVQPVEKLAAWAELEQQARSSFELAFAPTTPGAGLGMQPRITFGWAALCEKLICAERGLDDVTLELVKMAILRGVDDSPLADTVELRFFDVNGGNLTFAWIEAAVEEMVESLEAPRKLYDEIAADPKGWQALREQLTAGPFVDVHRLLVPQGKLAGETNDGSSAT